jgi:hypothetical protein
MGFSECLVSVQPAFGAQSLDDPLRGFEALTLGIVDDASAVDLRCTLAESQPGVVLANVALSTRKSMSACCPPSETVKTLIWVTIGVFASMFGTSRSSMSPAVVLFDTTILESRATAHAGSGWPAVPLTGDCAPIR